MRRILFLLALLPAIALAQTPSTPTPWSSGVLNIPFKFT